MVADMCLLYGEVVFDCDEREGSYCSAVMLVRTVCLENLKQRSGLAEYWMGGNRANEWKATISSMQEGIKA